MTYGPKEIDDCIRTIVVETSNEYKRTLEFYSRKLENIGPTDYDEPAYTYGSMEAINDCLAKLEKCNSVNDLNDLRSYIDRKSKELYDIIADKIRGMRMGYLGAMVPLGVKLDLNRDVLYGRTSDILGEFDPNYNCGSNIMDKISKQHDGQHCSEIHNGIYIECCAHNLYR